MKAWFGGPVEKLNGTLRCSLALALTAYFAETVLAADISDQERRVPIGAPPAKVHDVVLEIGPGVVMRPAYEGAKGYEFDPTGFFSLHHLRIPGIGIVKKERADEGFSLSPSFRYVRKRDSGDHPELRGLDDVDAAFELGGRVAYQWSMFRPWLALRHGFGGHDGIVAETGLELRFRPSSVTELAMGPRASFATGQYLKTYFGVTTAESVRSGLSVFSPGSGIKGAGYEVSGRYEFTPKWALVGTTSYERLIGDAAESPIVKLGNEHQIAARFGLTYKFGSKLFND